MRADARDFASIAGAVKNKLTPALSHVNHRGHARMVDVGPKDVTARRAVARARVLMSDDTFQHLVSGDTPKGDVLAAARIAGIHAAKRTSELIPLCHIVNLTRVEVSIALDDGVAVIDASAEARDRTGVEMEAMVAASTAALTLYDMLKAIDRSMSFDVCLIEKAGGASGTWRRGRDEGAMAEVAAPASAVKAVKAVKARAAKTARPAKTASSTKTAPAKGAHGRGAPRRRAP